MGSEQEPRKISIPRLGIKGELPAGLPPGRMGGEVEQMSATDLIKTFLERNPTIQSYLEIRADPTTIRQAAHFALDQVLDRIEPDWQANREQALGQI